MNTNDPTREGVLRNPLIAEAFHRTGAVEIWGRGTNRVIEACQRYGIEPTVFEVALFVVFRAVIGPGPGKGLGRNQVGTKSALSTEQVEVLKAALDSKGIQVLIEACRRSNRTKFRNQVLRPLLESGLLTMTIPDKPTSSQQQYLTTGTGKRILDEVKATTG